MILTFYSYKGGVGRSMALANVGDLLARRGLRVLMIDFDLEAPGLEQYFPIDHKSVRGHLGLLDLILRYKQAMSLRPEAAGENAEFRKLRDLFISPIYNQLPSGGRLDLLPAGQRGTDEDLSRYALALRTFDWQDFYFNWAGELFFEWLRRTLVPGLYDIILVDSRTGVTEMGGICAYQLADALVVPCGTSHQSVQGTENVVRNFFSDRVRELRRNRPLEVLVVPARVEQRDSESVKEFRERFERAFTVFTPAAMKKAGTSFWDLLIPYEPRYALEEQVITDPGRAADRQKVAGAFRRLVEAVTLLSGPGSKLREKSEEPHTKLAAAEPQYDVARRFARYDVFLSHAAGDKPAVEKLARRLLEAGIKPFLDKWHLIPGEPWQEVIESALEQSRSCAIFLGVGKMGPWENEEMRAVLDAQSRGGKRIIPVLLPGAYLHPDSIPVFLRRITWVDFRAGLDDSEAFSRLVAGIRGEALGPAPRVEIERGSPFRGLEAFGEQDAAFFFGREELVNNMVLKAQLQNVLAVVGPSGSGKSSAVQAGLIPALRQTAAKTGAEVSFITVRPGRHPLLNLARAVASLLDRHFTGVDPADELTIFLESPGLDLLKRRRVVIIDQLEEAWTQGALVDECSEFFHFILRLQELFLVVLVLRSDFLPRVSEHRELADAVERGMVLVGPMREDELRSAIESPARSTGLAFEPGLVELILEDVKGSPGALPLLQFALLQLWERRRQGFLSVEAYREIGGTGGALAAKADMVFESYDEKSSAEIRRILLRLIQPGEGGADTRRRVGLQDLVPAEGSKEAVIALIEPMVEARLLTVTFDEVTGSSVELSHEAMIRVWPRLRSWIDQSREEMKEQRRLEFAAREWDAAYRSQDFLWRGERLARASDWLQRSYITPTALEREFFETSSAQAKLEKMLDRKRRRRWVIPITASLGLTILASIAAGSSYWRKLQLEDKTRHLAQESILARKAAVRSSQAAATAYSFDGRRVFAISPERTGRLLDAFTGRSLLPADFLLTDITASSFSPDSSALAVGTETGELVLIRFFDERRQVLRLSQEHKAAIRSLAFSPDSSILASGGDDGKVRCWRVKDGGLASAFSADDLGVIALRFSPDGERLVVAGARGKIRSWSPDK